MSLWSRNFGDQIIEVNYEELTLDPDWQVRKLLKKLGLPWDEECLHPERNPNVVATASAVQIREKIRRGTSSDWEKFKPFLNGAFDCLDKDK